MIVVDSSWPSACCEALGAGLPDEQLGLPATHHHRLLQRLYEPGTGRLASYSATSPRRSRHAPRLAVLIEPRSLLDSAAEIGARLGAAGLLVTKTPAAGLGHGRHLYFGAAGNVGDRLATIAAELAVTVTVLSA